MASPEQGSSTCRKNTQNRRWPPAQATQPGNLSCRTASVMFVSLDADGVSGAGLWHMPEGDAPLQQRAELEVQATRVRALAWHPERADSAVTVEDRSVVQWRFEGASAEACPVRHELNCTTRHAEPD